MAIPPTTLTGIQGAIKEIALTSEYKIAIEAATPQEKQILADTTAPETQKLTDTHKRATEATIQPIEENSTPEKTAEQIAAEKKQQREEWLKAVKKGPEKTHNNLGYYLNDAGERVFTNDPVTKDMGDAINSFFEMVLAFINGGSDLEYWHMKQDFEARNNMTTEERYAGDPSARYSSKTSTPLRDELKAEAPEKYASTLAAAQSLLKIISDTESSGNAGVINDYRSRIPSLKDQGPYPGLKTGDTTLGGKEVPDFSTMSVNEVIQWQKDYIKEQKEYIGDDFPHGIPIPLKKFPKLSDEEERAAQIKAHGLEEVERSEAAKVKGVYRSSAIGQFQFTYSTLEKMRDNNYVKGDEKFTADAQGRAAVGLIIKTIGENKNMSPEKMLEKMQGQWEGLKNADPQDLLNIMSALKKDDNLVAALQTEYKLPTPT